MLSPYISYQTVRLCALMAILLLPFGRPTLYAQVPMPEGLAPQLDAVGAELLFPVDAGYKWFDLEPSAPFQPCTFGIFSRKEKLEIRYLMEPYDTTNPEADFPHFWATRQVINLASNDEDDLITAHSLPDSMLTAFNANWGKLFFFHPKKSFSSRTNCQFLALFREGKGLAGLFFLFDEPSEALDRRMWGIRFKE